MLALSPIPLIMAAFMATAPGLAASTGLDLAWSAEGFAEPAAVAYDPEREVLYVANVNAETSAEPGQGFISKLGTDGVTLERDWVGGLNAPTALVLHGGLLYVADVDRLVAIDVEGGVVLEGYQVPSAHTLGGLAVDAGGRVYAADLTQNVIFAFDHGSMQPWIEDEALESPSALLAENERLVIASWGLLSDGLSTEEPGHLKAVDYASRKIHDLGEPTPIGNLAGVKAGLDGGYLLTDATAGSLLRADATGGASAIQDLPAGAAGLEVVPAERLVVIPLRLDDRVVAYRLP
jgi:DNA-binding beta-propeller fold protein YncE